MGKTVRAVSQIALGAGMVAVGVLSTTITAGTSSFLIGAGVSMMLGGGGQLLAPKPKSLDGSIANTSFAQKTRARTHMIRSSVSPRQVVYGETIGSGVLVAAFSSGTDNQYMHLFVALAGHEVESIDDVWLGETLSTDSKFSGLVRINKNLGSTSQAADSDAVSEITEWTTAHQLKGIAYLYVRLKWDADVWVSGLPNIKALIKGKKVYDTRTTTTIWSDNPILCQRDFLVNEFGATSSEVDDTVVTAQANICDEDVASKVTGSITGFANAGGGQVTVTSVNHNLSENSDVTISETTNYNGTFSATNITPNTYEITDTFIIDDATGTWKKALTGASDAGSGEVTMNSIAHGLVKGEKVTQSETTDYNGEYAIQSITADTYNITDTYVSSQTGVIDSSSQTRYICNGIYTKDGTPINIMEDLKSSCAGTNTRQQGTYKLFAGAYTTPTVELDEDDLRGDLLLQTNDGRKDLFNAVKGEYVDASNDYLPTNFAPLTNSTYESEDGGIQLFKTIELPFTDNSKRAQRISKIHLQRARQGVRVTFPAKMTAYSLAAWDTVNVTVAKLGWSSKSFRVLSWALSEEGGVDLQLQEDVAADWAWTAEEVHIGNMADMTVPDPTVVATPTGLALASGATHLVVKADGTQISRIQASWSASTDQLILSGGVHEIEFKKSADSDWTSAPNAGGAATFGYISDVDDGVGYDVRVRALNARGVRGAFATVTSHTVAGKSDVPSTPTGLAATGRRLSILLEWTANSEVDVLGYDIQRADDSGFTTNLVTLCDVYGGNYYLDNLGVKAITRYYRIRAHSRSDLQSPYTSGVNATTAGIDTAEINALAVGTAELAALAVENAKIANLAVDTGQIANDAVETVKVLDNNITVNGAQTIAGVISGSGTTWTTAATVTITTTGSPVAIFAKGESLQGALVSWSYNQFRIVHDNGTPVVINSCSESNYFINNNDATRVNWGYWGSGTIWSPYYNVCLIGIYAPSSGSNTFKLQFNCTKGSTTPDMKERSIVAIELKK